MALVLLIFPLQWEFSWLSQQLTGVVRNSLSTSCFSVHNPRSAMLTKQSGGASVLPGGALTPQQCRVGFPACAPACALPPRRQPVTSPCCACPWVPRAAGRPLLLSTCPGAAPALWQENGGLSFRGRWSAWKSSDSTGWFWPLPSWCVL